MVNHISVPLGARAGDPNAPKAKKRPMTQAETARRRRLHSETTDKREAMRRAWRERELGSADPLDLAGRIVAAALKAVEDGDLGSLKALDSVLNGEPPAEKPARKTGRAT